MSSGIWRDEGRMQWQNNVIMSLLIPVILGNRQDYSYLKFGCNDSELCHTARCIKLNGGHFERTVYDNLSSATRMPLCTGKFPTLSSSIVIWTSLMVWTIIWGWVPAGGANCVPASSGSLWQWTIRGPWHWAARDIPVFSLRCVRCLR